MRKKLLKTLGLALILGVIASIIIFSNLPYLDRFLGKITGKASSEYKQNGVLSYYNFDENTDDLLGNSDCLNSKVMFSEGEFGKAAKFSDGSYLDCGNSMILADNKDFSACLWINPNLNENGQSIFGKHYSHEFEIALSPDGKIIFYHGDGEEEKIESSFSIPENIWSFVCIIRDSENKKVKFYLNNNLEEEKSYEKEILQSNNKLYIGGRFGIVNSFEGKIDNLALYSGVLSNELMSNFFEGKFDEASAKRILCGESDDYKIVYAGGDKIECGEKKGCTPNIECEEWSRCRVDYSFSNVNQVNATKEKMSRICRDLNGCSDDQYETQECPSETEIYTKEFQKCGKAYIGIYDKADDKIIGRIEKGEERNNLFMNINLGEDEFDKNSYCEYCFDGVRNMDEEEIDCGGSCPECTGAYREQKTEKSAIIQAFDYFFSG